MLLLYIIIYSPKLLYMYVVYRTHDKYLSHQDPRKAIHFYTEAQCYTPALQLAKELELNNDLMRLALLSSHEDMIDAARSVLCRRCVCTCTALKTAVWFAYCIIKLYSCSTRYYERNPDTLDKAIMLYHKVCKHSVC